MIAASTNFRFDQFLITFGSQQGHPFGFVRRLELENPRLVGVLVDFFRRGSTDESQNIFDRRESTCLAP
jgi:hypothetical protein